jgi:hypothetical protein
MLVVKKLNVNSIYNINKKYFIKLSNQIGKENFKNLSLKSKILNLHLKTMKVSKGEILVNQSNLGNKSSSKKFYLVYKASEPKFILLLKQFAILSLFTLTTIYTFKDKIARLFNKRSLKPHKLVKLISFSISLYLLFFIIRSPKMKISKTIKQLEIDYDLKAVKILTYTDKMLMDKSSDLYIVNPTMQKALSNKFIFDDIIIGIKGKSYSVPLKLGIIPDEELFFTVLNGYNLNIAPKIQKA